MLVAQRSALPRYLIRRILAEAAQPGTPTHQRTLWTSRPLATLAHVASSPAVAIGSYPFSSIRSTSAGSSKYELGGPSLGALPHERPGRSFRLDRSPPSQTVKSTGQPTASRRRGSRPPPWRTATTQPFTEGVADGGGEGESLNGGRSSSQSATAPQSGIVEPKLGVTGSSRPGDPGPTSRSAAVFRQSRRDNFLSRVRAAVHPFKSPGSLSEAHIAQVVDLFDSADSGMPEALRSYAYGVAASAMLHRPDCTKHLAQLLQRQVQDGCPFDTTFLYDAAQMTIAHPDRPLPVLWDDTLRWLAFRSRQPEQFVSAFLASTPGPLENVQQLLAVLTKVQRARGIQWSWSKWIIMAEHYRRTHDLKAAVRSLPSMQMAIETRFQSGLHPFTAEDRVALSRVYTSLMTCWVDTWCLTRRELLTKDLSRPTKDFPPLLAKQYRGILTRLGVDDVPVPFLCAWLNAERLCGNIHQRHQVWCYVRQQSAQNYTASQHVQLWKGMLEAARTMGSSHSYNLRGIVKDMLLRLPGMEMQRKLLHGIIRCVLSPTTPPEPLIRESHKTRLSDTTDLALLHGALRMFDARGDSRLAPDSTAIDETAWGIIKLWLRTPALDPVFVTPHQPLQAVQRARKLLVARRDHFDKLSPIKKQRFSGGQMYNEAWVIMSLALHWRREAAGAFAADGPHSQQRICHLPVSKVRPPTLQRLYARYEAQTAHATESASKLGTGAFKQKKKLRKAMLRDYLDVQNLYGGGVALQDGTVMPELRDVRETRTAECLDKEHEERHNAWMGASLVRPLVRLVEDIMRVQAAADLRWEKLGRGEAEIDQWIAAAMATAREQTGMDVWQEAYDRASAPNAAARQDTQAENEQEQVSISREDQLDDVLDGQAQGDEAVNAQAQERLWRAESEGRLASDELSEPQ